MDTLKKDRTYFVQNRNDIELQVFGIIMDVLKEESGEKRTAISLEEAVPKIFFSSKYIYDSKISL